MIDESILRNSISDWQCFLGEDHDLRLIDALRKQTSTGRPFGDDRFIDSLEHKTGRRLRRRKPGPRASLER